MCPGVESASKNEYQENSWGWRRSVRKGDDLTTFIVPEALTFRIPKGLLRPVAGKRYLYLIIIFDTKRVLSYLLY
jgi:hypothetical protein